MDSLLLFFPLFVHFLSFKVKFVSQFSPELCKLDSSNVVYICGMNDCIMGLRLRVMAFIFLFFINFSFFPYKKCKHLKFVSEFSQELLKLEYSNFVYKWTTSCCIVGL